MFFFVVVFGAFGFRFGRDSDERNIMFFIVEFLKMFVIFCVFVFICWFFLKVCLYKC